MENKLRWIGFIYIFYVITCLSWFQCTSGFLYTFGRPVNGTLYSEWGNLRFMFLFLTSFVLIIPYLSFREMIYKSRKAPYNTYRFWVHVVLSVLLLFLLLVFLIFNAIDWGNANLSAQDNARNPFNDPRWCCVAANIAVAAGLCDNSISCPSAPTQNSLVTNGNAIAMIVLLNFVPLLVGIANLAFTLTVMKRIIVAPSATSYSVLPTPPTQSAGVSMRLRQSLLKQ